MEKKFVLGFVVLIILVAGTLFFNGSLSNKTYEGERKDSVRMHVTEENFVEYLNSQSMIKDVPDDAKIKLVVGESVYSIENGNIVEKDIEEPEIIIHLGEEYIEEFSNGLCPTLQKARSDGNLWWETNMNSVKLAWKYGKLLKYKDCLV